MALQRDPPFLDQALLLRLLHPFNPYRAEIYSDLLSAFKTIMAAAGMRGGD